MARLFRAAERQFGSVAAPDARRIAGLSPLRANRVLRALRDAAGIPRRQLETPVRRAALAIMRSHTPVRRLVSRHTRELLRRYHEKGLLATPIAERSVEDRFVEMTAGERGLYDAVEDYIATTYNQAAADERTAVGFVMTIYRRRLASSFQALRTTLERHLDAVAAAGDSPVGTGASDSPAPLFASLDEDVSDDETSDEAPDVDEVVVLEQQALAFEEAADIRGLLDGIGRLPPDGKVQELKRVIHELRRDGFAQAMVFTQYTDTMDFLREELGAWDAAPTEAKPGAPESRADGSQHRDSGRADGSLPESPENGSQSTDRHAGALRLMCFSGRGGEVRSAGGAWSTIGRDEVKRRFREGEADLLLCTDAAAEGLNFQFCGALINYDMPWNPMRVEQRIGRIDRLGQAHPAIRIVNLHYYAGTVETDVFRLIFDTCRPRALLGLEEQDRATSVRLVAVVRRRRRRAPGEGHRAQERAGEGLRSDGAAGGCGCCYRNPGRAAGSRGHDARSNTLLATEVVPFPLSLVRLLATSVHEDAHQGHESCDECHQTRDIPARVQQHAADADDEENHDEAENLTPSLGRDLLGNDPRFKRASVGCLCFGHRHDPIRTAGEDRLVSFKRFRGRNRSLEVLDGCVLNRERAGWPVRRFCRHHGLGRLSVRLAGSHLPAHARSPSSRPRDPLR